jgi:hypothetical protein
MKLIRFVSLIFVEYLLILIKPLGPTRAVLNPIPTNVVLSDIDTFKKLLKQLKILQQLKRLLDEDKPIEQEDARHHKRSKTNSQHNDFISISMETC